MKIGDKCGKCDNGELMEYIPGEPGSFVCCNKCEWCFKIITLTDDFQKVVVQKVPDVVAVAGVKIIEDDDIVAFV